MKQMIWKELRENGMWALLGMIGMLIALSVSLQVWEAARLHWSARPSSRFS